MRGLFPMGGGAAGRSATAGVLVILAALLALAVPAAARVLHVYEVRYRVAEELAPLVQTALGEDGRVMADGRTNSLVLTGEAAAVKEALALLERIDTRLRTVVLRYSSEDASSLAARDVRVDWRIEAGGLRIGSLSRPAKRAEADVAVRAGERELQGEGTHVSTLRILEGESGRIATGVSAPLTTRRDVPTRRGAGGYEANGLVSAESGFEARPRVLGDGRIELSLRPFHGRLGPDGHIETAGAETRVVIAPGETLVLGELGDTQQGNDGRLLESSTGSEGVRVRLLLVSASVD